MPEPLILTYTVDSLQSLQRPLSLRFTGHDLKDTDQSDPLFINSDYNTTNYSFGAGLMYVHRYLEISIAAPSLTTVNGRTNNFLAYAEYTYWVNDQFKLKPSLRVKRSLVKTYMTDINLLVDYRNKIWLQAGYRTNGNMLASAGVTVQGIGIGVGYELPVSSKNSFTKGSLEVLASYQFPDFKRKKSKTEL